MKHAIFFLALIGFQAATFGQAILDDGIFYPCEHELMLDHSAVTTKNTDQEDFEPALQDSFQLALQAMSDEHEAIGLSAAVLSDDGDIWTGSTGISHTGVPLTGEMYQGMGSITKSITAACLIRLHEDGVLSIYDTIGHYLDPQQYVNGQVTIRQLLNHTSGIYNYTDHPSMLDSMQEDLSRIWSPQEILDYFVLDPLFVPGTGWYYSNTNYILAGLIIEEVTGVPYHDAVRDMILGPNGLDSLFLRPYETTTAPIAHIWSNTQFGDFDLDAINQTPISIYSSGWAAGGYFSTPSLIAHWFQKLLTGEVLSEDGLALMQDYVDDGFNGYGLGIGISEEEGYQAWGHQGYIIYSSIGAYIPDLGLTIALQSNDSGVLQLRPFVKKIVQLYDQTVPITTINPSLATVFPMPAGNSCEISWGQPILGKTMFQLVDMVGKSHDFPIISIDEQTLRIRVNHLPDGLYFLKGSGPDNLLAKIMVMSPN